MTEFEKWLNKKIILLDNIGLDIDGYSLAELKAYQKVLAKYQELVDKDYSCPNCVMYLESNHKTYYCPNCGQALDLGDDGEVSI